MTPPSGTSELLVVFVKLPEPGRVKTRLAAGVGDAQAVAIYRELVAHTLRAVGEWLDASAEQSPEAPNRKVWLYFDPAAREASIRTWLSPDVAGWIPGPGWVPQPDGDLGHRLQYVFAQGFDDGFSAIGAIGTDCPSLAGTDLCDLFRSLPQCDVALGPSADGGYYAIAMKSRHDPLFEGISWSSSRVFEESRAAAERLGLSVRTLSVREDVDTEADWRRWQTSCGN